MVTRSSYSVYPDQLDAYGTLPLVSDAVSEIRAQDHNALRDAIIKIEQELGTGPSGTYGTVASRLDSVTDASALISAHLIDAVDAHDASAVSVLDAGDNYTSAEVEGVLGELAAALPSRPDVIGEDQSAVPNSGTPSFVSGAGTLHVFNTSGSDILKSTQTVNVVGVHIIEVGTSNGNGAAELEYTNAPDPQTLAWKAPGESVFGTAVNISAASAGDVYIITSGGGKKIRVAITPADLDATGKTDTFELFKMDGASGTFSITGTGFKATENITRTATTAVNPNNRDQFMIGGTVYPADRGTLVLQRKLRTNSDFIPIAVLDLGANFSTALIESGQPAYTPTLEDYDTVTLFDRLPVRNDYESLALDANGSSVYTNYDFATTFTAFQLAKYLIPVSNDSAAISYAELEPITDVSDAEVGAKISTYRIVHYISGVTDFTGEPAAADIFSVSDALGAVSDGDNTVRFGNLVVDSSETRPGFGTSVVTNELELTPVSNTESVTKEISGIHYYNSDADTFDVEVESDTNLFTATYLRESILRFTTDVFEFPSGTDSGAYGLLVDVDELVEDDGVTKYSASNLPDFSTAGKQEGLYLINSGSNTARRPYIDGYQFSTRALVSAQFYDPFGGSVVADAYGDGTIDRILVNSYDGYYGELVPDETHEYFVSEEWRVGTTETFDLDLGDDEFEYNDNPLLDIWDPGAVLTPGDLQCGGKFTAIDVNYPGLIFPQSDYTDANTRPTQNALADYSGGSYDVESKYQRLFSLGYPTNGGRLRIVSSGSSLLSFDDMDEFNTNRFVAIYVKIPGAIGSNNKTGWLDLGKLFETGKVVDGDGALAGPITGTSGDFTVPFTFGAKNNADTGNMIAVKIVYAPGGWRVSQAKEKIISMIELLAPA